MMKYTLLLLLLPVFGVAQSDSLLRYTEVIIIDSATKDELFSKARHWFANTWRSSKDVLQVDDKQSGELFGKGFIKGYYIARSFGKDQKYAATYRIDVGVYIKDGKYKYEFSNFRPESDNEAINSVGILTSSNVCPVKFAMMSQKKSDDIYNSMKRSVDTEMKILIASLKNEMASAKSKMDF